MYPKQPWSRGKLAATTRAGYPIDQFEAAIHVGPRETPGNRIATVHLGGEGADNDTREAVEATADRIVTCVNACAGMDSVVLAAWKLQGRSIRSELDNAQNAVIELHEQRDALFAALREMVELHRETFGAHSQAPELTDAEALVASVAEDIREEQRIS